MKVFPANAGTSQSNQAPDAHPTNNAPLLEIRNLDVHFRTDNGVARVVDDANLTVYRNEIVGIAGESGSGKTTLVEAILQIIRFRNRETHGQVLFSTRLNQQLDLMKASAHEMQRLRLNEIAYIPQGSMNALNPVLRIEDQIVDGLVDHGISPRQASKRVSEVLDWVGLEAKVARLYPHELSGGMKQRVIIAIAISMEPSLIIADEPTTALDVNVQRRILETLARLRDEMRVSIMMVSHDMAVHAQLVDRVAIMYAGQIVETGGVRPIVRTPLHPYTHGLMSSIPSIDKPRERLEGIRGATPSPRNWPAGCRFHNRCPKAMPICTTVPPLLAPVRTAVRETMSGNIKVQPGSEVACHLYPESTPQQVDRKSAGENH